MKYWAGRTPFISAGYIGTVATVMIALTFGSSMASAAIPGHRHPPGHGGRCRRGFKKVKRHDKPTCVKTKKTRKQSRSVPRSFSPVLPPETISAPTTTRVELYAHVDPEYRQNPLDPFEATYKFSAQAVEQTLSSGSIPIGAPAPSPLPPGVLKLTSDGHGECSVPVGGPVEHSECAVEYKKLGAHTVTATYSTGAGSYTESVTVDVGPYPTRPILTVNYVPMFEPKLVEPESRLWEIGELSVSESAEPGTLQAYRACVFDPNVAVGDVDREGCYVFLGWRPVVFAVATGNCLAPEIEDIRIGEERWGALRAQVMTLPQIEGGAFHFRAEIPGSEGYARSETTTAIQFKPFRTLPSEC